MADSGRTFDYFGEFLRGSVVHGLRAVMGLLGLIFGFGLLSYFAILTGDNHNALRDGFIAGIAAPAGLLAGAFIIFRDTRRTLESLRSELKPLIATTDTDGRFRRLRVENPNAVPVKQVSVSVVSYDDADGHDLTTSGPYRKHRFPWQTQARDTASKFTDIAAAGHEFADILVLQPVPENGFPGGLFYHLDIGPNATVQRFSPSNSGTYEMVVEITAVDPPIPAALFALHISFVGNHTLEMAVTPIKPDPTAGDRQ